MSRMDGVGDALRYLREERDLTQRQVAAELGVQPAMISAWERGKSAPTLARLGQLADILGLDLGDLDDALAITQRRPPPPPSSRREAAGRQQADPPQLVKLLLGAPGLFPATPAEQTLSALLNDLRLLLAQLREGKGPWPDTPPGEPPPEPPRPRRRAGPGGGHGRKK